ncbi:MAG: UDP-N-acetylmuramyl pentapeptide phosphotransferase/UDP-N-acetylglucosamine-1-phosphate transferase [Candidatus Roizmanbacteria bacterium GW2011_GWC2_37_13]|uniref:UDP-N-acetylmuramyl pentapeptide phosphotransferase/UDP-N-acetylglucosamine-1-phosphate transferase n=1 Tax=Candidatus Roizmanbacteria bacterium GW2011_GWC2_37_13 TaxID=1618486 RepID=A0A0G0IJD1_9BACT|nr:MAG: UDP-N-acetylmuramyl pentapeptide phosphotransferase/UDP-N-acetylglucosamine-1-phosphate transferase [Candidatus Roizmanbacteria bacterium GW2011_GWC1_37_12]KKQ24319.1 MAG: UDP-N-acetylmuramyl pentapeptide phosphotransferase/UDP-N-acetylglucosamine-1-phosphate transferase [Candidatus Roizmanbacteria bacterium GW2011_GWC2_37_13]
MLIAFFLSFLFALMATVPTIYLAKRLNLVTDVKKRLHPAHTHKGIIPRGGGVPIFLSILLTTIILLPLSKIIIGILLSCFLLVILGLLDDHGDISPYFRFFANLLISAVVIGFGLGIPYISNPFGGVIRLDAWQVTINIFGTHSIWILADFLAIIWLTWTTNMVNWSKGVDGQLPGFVAITAIFLGILSQRFTVHDISVQSVAIFSFIVAGAYLGFLPFNFYPQKIMPGYGGGALAGFLLGIISILSFGKIGTAVLVLSVPMIDAVYTILRRLKKGKSIFRSDWGHFHHRLLEIGWGKRRIAIFYWLISLILGISSLFLKGIEKLAAFVMIGIVLLFFIVIINRMKKTVKIVSEEE